MFSADDIIRLEKKWLRYKIKQRSKIPMLFMIILFVALGAYFIPSFLQNQEPKKPITSVKVPEKMTKKINSTKLTSKDTMPEKKSISKTYKNTLPINTQENNITKKEEKVAVATADIVKTQEKVKKPIKKNKKPFSYTLQPTIQKNELFYSDGTLTYTPPYSALEDIVEPTKKKVIKTEVVQPITVSKPKEEKVNVSISMKEIDTTTYLKEKFYSSSNIVFALMLAEEYYNNKDYEQSAKWSLTANDIDPSNDKSWYWFAKAKVKMEQKNDAIRTLKAYLRNNKSNRLETLLNKIEHGVSDD